MGEFLTIDIVVCSIILVLGFKGVLNGFVKEFFGLVGLVGGVFLGTRFAMLAGEYVDKNFLNIDNKASIFLIGFLGVLILVWTISVALGHIFEKLIAASGLGFFDRFLGFLAGSSKVFLVFSILAYTVSNIDFIKEYLSKYTKDSLIYPIFEKTGGYIVKLDLSSIAKNVPQFDQNNTLEQVK